MVDQEKGCQCEGAHLRQERLCPEELQNIGKSTREHGFTSRRGSDQLVDLTFVGYESISNLGKPVLSNDKEYNSFSYMIVSI